MDPETQAPPVESRHTETKVLLWALAALVVIAGGVYFGSGYARNMGQQELDRQFAEIQETVQLQMQGEYEESARRAAQLGPELSPSTVNYQRNITALATAEFWSGEKERRLEAVRLTKKQLAEAPGSTRNQALLINRLIGYMTTAMEPEIITEVFNSDPFQHLYDPSNDTDSIFSNLALESISRFPTTAANARVGIWHAGKIFKDYDGIAKLSAAEKKEHVEGMLYRISEMNRILPSEKQIPMLYSQLSEAQFAYYQGFIYGALALTDESYLDDMETAFAKVHEEYRVERNDKGEPITLLESRIPYTNFAYANYLYAIEGSARMADVEKYLQQVVDLVTAHPDVHKGAFLSFMNQTAVDGPEGTKGRWYSYERFVRMANLYPPFKEFLNANGWGL